MRSQTWQALGPVLGGLGLAALLAIGGLLAWSRWQASAVGNMSNVPLAVGPQG